MVETALAARNETVYFPHQTGRWIFPDSPALIDPNWNRQQEQNEENDVILKEPRGKNTRRWCRR